MSQKKLEELHKEKIIFETVFNIAEIPYKFFIEEWKEEFYLRVVD